MPKVLSKRALEGRRWRVQARQKRKLNTIISKYIEEKHEDIYAKCVMFYDRVVSKYPEVQNLTKTEEFQLMLKTTDGSYQTGTHQDQTAAVVSEQAGTTHQDETAAVVSEQAGTTHQDETAAVVSEQAGTAHQDETAAVVNEQAGTQDESISVTPGYTYVEPGLIINEYVVNNNNNADILSEAMDGAVGDIDGGFDRLADMDTIVNEIIRDLETVEPSIFEDLNDEGIGLNTEDEVGNMLNDYNLW